MASSIGPGRRKAGLAGFLPALASIPTERPSADRLLLRIRRISAVGWPNSTGVWGARVFFAGRVICSASPHGHEGEASARFLIGQHRGAAPAAIQAGSEDTLAPCVTRRGVRAATGHEKGRSGQVTGRPAQKMHVVATIA